MPLDRVESPRVFPRLFLWIASIVLCVRGLSDAASDIEKRMAGHKLARQYCVTCHLFPDPGAVDLKTWHDEILPRMKYRLGFTSPELERSTNIQILRANGRIPLQPVITEEQWMTLSEFYFAEAPKVARSQPAHDEISVGGHPFRVAPVEFRGEGQSIASVAVDPVRHEVWLGDDAARAIHRLDGKGALIATMALSNSPARIRFRNGEALVACLGLLPPNDLQAGTILKMTAGPSPGAPEVLLTDLRRPVDALSLDDGGDSRVIVAEFGNNIGALSSHRKSGEAAWTATKILAVPGTVRLERGDFDRDGHVDFAALVAQETEALFLFRGDGKGVFQQKTLFQKPPQYGHSNFETADFDGDGRLDFLVCNGDNGEFNSPLKPYHGVRIYLTQADGTVVEKWFYPLNGAYGACARDFDGDGDLDIAAISYFPDYAKNPRESFVYFENLGGWRFRPSTIKECIAGRWMSMAVGDLDGDGDDDLVLGSYINGPTGVPDFLMKMWNASRIPALILYNKTREPKP